MLTFGSLFAGIGGFDLGFERAGFKCKWQVEIDGYATRVLAKHWPGVDRFRDIRECGPGNLQYVNCIIGGFPCQDISYAGKGAGLAGERSGLFYEAMRIVGDLGPKYVVLENVAALLTRGIDQVLGTLASLGYDAEWHCIPAAAVGAPHRRDRVFVLGWDANCGEQSKKRVVSSEYKSESSRDSQAIPNPNITRPQGMRTEWENTQREAASGFARPSHSSGNGQWEIEPAVGRVADGVSRRVDRLGCLGNAIVPQVAEYVANRVLQLDAISHLPPLP